MAGVGIGIDDKGVAFEPDAVELLIKLRGFHQRLLTDCNHLDTLSIRATEEASHHPSEAGSETNPGMFTLIDIEIGRIVGTYTDLCHNIDAITRRIDRKCWDHRNDGEDVNSAADLPHPTGNECKPIIRRKFSKAKSAFQE